MPQPRVEIITLSYNSRRFVDGYLAGLSALQYPSAQLSVNLLDNGSQDDSWGVLQAHSGALPAGLEIRLERSPDNLGFTGGNNRLLKSALQRGAPYFLLLNIDTQIGPQCLAKLVDRMQADPSLGMAEARQRPREHPKWFDPDTGETGWCSCGGVLIRRQALEQIGLFDGRFFLYCEDVDLSWRMWLHGWRCVFVPEAEYQHFTEGLDPAKDGTRQLFFSLRNSFFLHLKYDSWRGIGRHLRFVRAEGRAQPTAELKRLYRRSARATLRHLAGLLHDRWTLPRGRNEKWIVFDGLNYERRRAFRDTPDGGRVIMDSLH